MDKIKINLNALLPAGFAPIGVIYGHNGCCHDKAYLLTVNKIEKSEDRPEGLNYSCQCSCGLWCTTGCKTPEEAIAEYERMSKESKSDIKLVSDYVFSKED